MSAPRRRSLLALLASGLVLLGGSWLTGPVAASRPSGWGAARGGEGAVEMRTVAVTADGQASRPGPTPSAAASVSPSPAGAVADRARPALARPRPPYPVVAPPSLSAAQIDTILAAYQSPAAGLGATFYDAGVAYGLDPAYALAFFVVESGAGTKGVARQTHSIGNIRCTAGYACVDGYRAYASWAAGVTDWFVLIRTLYVDQWELTTPATILPRYAPWGDHNNPTAYAAQVVMLVTTWATP